MTRTVLVAGTASHVGKSTVATGLCRLLADRGVSVAPFKAQNMSNNARVVVRPGSGESDQTATPSAASSGEESDQTATPCAASSGGEPTGADDRWGEIGVSQFVQARAARTTPTTRSNPVLLKPRGNGESQLVLDGRAVEHIPAGAYYDEYWERARSVAIEAYEQLAADYDVVIAEGAGSIGEINLHHRDLANVETAAFADAAVLLVVDIERGGAFASLYGTIELAPPALRERIVGAVITKFRGDRSLLEPGIEAIEDRTGVPILGVLPYADPGLPEEDSVALPGPEEAAKRGGDDGVPADQRLTIAVPRLARLSNATDLEALAAEPGVTISYVSLEGASSEPLADADAVVVPGTKNTVDDLRALRASPVAEAIREFDGPIVGLCGGYQLLGERLTNATLEGTGEVEELQGLGVLPVETRFDERKRLEQVTVSVDGSGSPLLAGVSGQATGYEIHAGRTRPTDDAVAQPLGPGSAATGVVLGTYLHGLFDNRPVRDAFLAAVADRAGREWPPSDGAADTSSGVAGETPADRAATLVREYVDCSPLGEPFVH